MNYQKVNYLQENRSHLYFNEYSHLVTFSLPELSAIRDRSHKTIDRVCKVRQNLNGRMKNFGGSWMHRYQRPISDDMVADLHNMLDWMLAQTSSYKLKISQDFGYFYTNSHEQVQDLHNLEYIRIHSAKQVQVDVPPNSIRIKKSKYLFRTYFKNQSLSIDDKQKLYTMLQNQPVRLGPGFNEWFQRYPMSKYVCDNFFVDHNDENILLLIGLTSGIKIKRTLNIISDK